MDINADFFLNTCLIERSNMTVAPSLSIKINLRNEKHSSKQFVSMINTLGKNFLAAATFKGLWDASFKTGQGKLVVYFGLHQSSLHFSRREDQKLLFIGSKFSFSYADI